MDDLLFRVGEFVVNSKMPEWGTGEVVESRGDGKFLVNFAVAGSKLMSGVMLTAVAMPAGFTLPKKLTGPASKGQSPRQPDDEKVRFRSDPMEAKRVITNVVHNKENVELLMAQLLASIGIADAIAPTAWAVTLYGNGFRLNVGSVEVLYFFDNVLVVNLIGTCGVGQFTGHLFKKSEYDIPGPHCAYHGSLDDYRSVKQLIEKHHSEFVQRASRKQSGEPRQGSTWASSHSPGLVEFAQLVRDGGLI